MTALPEQDIRCAAAGCLRKLVARRMCMMHYMRWHRGERIDGYVAPIEAAPTMPLSPIDRAHANAVEVERKRELHAARLAGCLLERAIASGRFDARPRRWE